jgi:hypothetical protein
MSKGRGFKKLKDVTIVKVDENCANFVVLFDEEGRRHVIEATVENNIPILTLTKEKKAKTEWPFPAEDSNKTHHEYD